MYTFCFNKIYPLKFQFNNIIRIINPKSSNEDSFKYSLLASLHYYDIFPNPERISKLKRYEDRYIFTHNTPKEFEMNSPNISLCVVDENNETYASNNISNNKAKIVKINDYRYAAMKPPRTRSIKLDKFLRDCLYKELTACILQNIIY